MPTEANSNPDRNPAAPKDLADVFTRLAGAAIAAQGRALVVERQADLGAVRDPVGIVAPVAMLQRAARKNASFFLSRLVREGVRALGNGDAAVNLFAAARTRLDAGADARTTVAALARTVDGHYAAARDLAAEAARLKDAAATDAATFSGALDAAIARVEGPDGALASVAAEIAGVDAAIAGNLDELIKSADAIGAGAASLVTFALTTVRNGKPDPKKDPRKEPEKQTGTEASQSGTPETAAGGGETDSGDANAGSTGSTGSTGGTGGDAGNSAQPGADMAKPFPIEALGAVSTGAAGVSAAVSAFSENNRRLSALYQRLAQLDALLAIARALGGQARGFADALEDFAAAADALATSWGRLAGDLDRLATAPDGSDTDGVRADVAAAALYWARLKTRLTELEAALAGLDGFFPREAAIAA